jgi:hypothetical protein
MDIEERGKIFDRLSEISIKIDLQPIPDPQYITEKIWECHRYIEEIEKFCITVSKELSVIQQALNNSQAEYETKKENLLTKNENIMALPNIKDREARANSLLREEQERIKNYQNDLISLNNLLKVINLKNKNLNRTNLDIKMLIRVLEAQLKLSPTSGFNATVKGLTEEMAKAITAETFNEANSKETKIEIIDPSTDLNIDDLLVKEAATELKEENSENDEEEIDEIENDLWNETVPIDPLLYETENKTIDIDQVIDFTGSDLKGGAIAEPKELPSKEMTDENQKEIRQNLVQPEKKPDKIGIDLDNFLDTLNIK